MTVGLLARLTGVELLKLRTTRIWWGLLIAAAALVLLLTFATASAFVSGRPGLGRLTDPASLRSIYGVGFGVGYIFVLALGVIAMAGEYRHQTVTATFLATPRRGLVVSAKLLAMFVVGAGYGLVLMVAAAVPAIVVLAGQGEGPHLDADGVLRTLALGVLGCGLWGIYGIGLATLIRNQVAALFVALGVQLVVGPLVAFTLSRFDATRAIAEYLPNSAWNALLAGATAQGAAEQRLPWWGGGLTLLAYAVLFAVLGWALTTRRDVT